MNMTSPSPSDKSDNVDYSKVKNLFSDHCDRYWAAGLPVMPLKQYTPDGGRDGKPTGKEPVALSWQALGSRMPTEAEKQSWKLFHRDGNIGLPLGQQSGLVAIDIDTDDEKLLKVILSVLPPSPWKRVGQKGMVLIYRYDGQAIIRIKFRDGEGKMQSLVEMLGAGSQVVLPPSIHPKTVRPYVANRDLVDVLDQVQSLPANIEQRLRDALHKAGLQLGGAKTKARGGARKSSTGRIGEGARNDTLFREASRLRGQGHDAEQIEALLHIYNRNSCVPPLSESEVADIAASTMRYDPNERHELNDTGNAERFVRDHGDRVRYVPDLKLWRVWDDTHWRDDPGDILVMRLAGETVERMREDAEAVAEGDAKKVLKSHARRSGDRARLKAMVDVAATLPGMTASSTAFDDLPGKLAVGNGMLDLATGELSPHDPTNLNTRCVPTAFNTEATAPLFTKFIERVQPDQEVRAFLQCYLGGALHGQRSEQIATFWHGRGRNGKSVLADTMLGLLPGYAVECSASAFLANDKANPNAPRPDIVRLMGSRLVLGAEASDRRRLDGVMLKRLTGDATLPARGLYSAEGAFPITFNIAVLTNPFPNVDEADDALWTRLVRVPFDVVIPPAERVPNLHKKILAAEAEGVLAWVVQGAIDYARNGLSIPAAIIEATALWRRRAGTIERFMRNCTRTTSGARTSMVFLHSEYVRFVQKVYGNPSGLESFRCRLEALGFSVTDDDDGETINDVLFMPPLTRLGASAGTSTT